MRMKRKQDELLPNSWRRSFPIFWQWTDDYCCNVRSLQFNESIDKIKTGPSCEILRTFSHFHLQNFKLDFIRIDFATYKQNVVLPFVKWTNVCDVVDRCCSESDSHKPAVTYFCVNDKEFFAVYWFWFNKETSQIYY